MSRHVMGTLRLRCAVLGLLACSGSVWSADAKPALFPGQSKANPQAQAEIWKKIEKWPNFWEGSWQGIERRDGKDEYQGVAYTPAAKKYIERFHSNAEDTQFANCKPPGMPRAMELAAMPIKFFLAPEMISIYLESVGEIRFIHMNKTKHSDDPSPTYLGESIGHWEGDTLVVDTVGFVDDLELSYATPNLPGGPSGGAAPAPPAGSAPAAAIPGGRPDGGVPRVPVSGPHGPNLRFVERMHMTDFNTLEIQTTIYDDTVFAKPVVFRPRVWHRFTAEKNEPKEWFCTSNRDELDSSGKLKYDVPAK